MPPKVIKYFGHLCKNFFMNLKNSPNLVTLIVTYPQSAQKFLEAKK